jgi:hypothetical protein
MIERFVMLKLRPGADRERVADAAREVLPRVPGVLGVRIGVPADADAEVWDLAIVVRFDRLEDVGRYLVDPDHAAFVEETLAPAVEVKKAWNFSLGDDPETV